MNYRFHKKYFISPVGHYMDILLIMLRSQMSVVIQRKSTVSEYVWPIAELDPDFTRSGITAKPDKLEV
jgi:hypothetical protein